MGQRETNQSPVKLFFALMFARAEIAEECEACLAAEFGPIGEKDAPYPFDPLTAYYAPEFGTGLQKRIIAVRDLIGPERLRDIKIRTNEIEEDFALRAHPGAAVPPRIVNLDPGYLNLAKLVLASTKDHAHRIYMGQGIFEEITLIYRREAGGFQPMPWTYPDYRMPERLAFFNQLRETCRVQLAGQQRKET